MRPNELISSIALPEFERPPLVEYQRQRQELPLQKCPAVSLDALHTIASLSMKGDDKGLSELEYLLEQMQQEVQRLEISFSRKS